MLYKKLNYVLSIQLLASKVEDLEHWLMVLNFLCRKLNPKNIELLDSIFVVES
jgi:hypothetical protein